MTYSSCVANAPLSYVYAETEHSVSFCSWSNEQRHEMTSVKTIVPMAAVKTSCPMAALSNDHLWSGKEVCTKGDKRFKCIWKEIERGNIQHSCFGLQCHCSHCTQQWLTTIRKFRLWEARYAIHGNCFSSTEKLTYETFVPQLIGIIELAQYCAIGDSLHNKHMAWNISKEAQHGCSWSACHYSSKS